jgi:hypothetical protein
MRFSSSQCFFLFLQFNKAGLHLARRREAGQPLAGRWKSVCRSENSLKSTDNSVSPAVIRAQAATRKEDLDPGSRTEDFRDKLHRVTSHWIFTVKWEIQFFFSILLIKWSSSVRATSPNVQPGLGPPDFSSPLLTRAVVAPLICSMRLFSPVKSVSSFETGIYVKGLLNKLIIHGLWFPESSTA